MMDTVLTELRQSSGEYWLAAVTPLRHLTWQTFSLLGFALLLAASIVALLLRYSWVLSEPAIRGATIVKKSHNYSSHLRLSVEDHLRFHRIVTQPMSELARDQRTLDETQYYVVTVVQAKPARALIYREMRLQAPPVGSARLPKGQIQIDARDLTEVRRRNSFEGDDDPDAEIEGTYDAYIRPVRWYDARHWLMHPNREIRILIWVTMLTTLIPTLVQIVFG